MLALPVLTMEPLMVGAAVGAARREVFGVEGRESRAD